jgi:hypothetical protein
MCEGRDSSGPNESRGDAGEMRLHLDEGRIDSPADYERRLKNLGLDKGPTTREVGRQERETRDEAAAKNYKDGYDAGRIQGMQDQLQRQQRIEDDRRKADYEVRRREYRGEPAGPSMDFKTVTEGPGKGNQSQRAVYGGTVGGGVLRQGTPEAGGVKRKVAEILATSKYSAEFHGRVAGQLRDKTDLAERAMELIRRNPEVAELMDLLEQLTK